MKTTISNLNAHITLLDNRVNELASSIQTALLRKNRISALSHLRSKKIAEKSLQQRSDTLIQLEEIYSKIQQAHDQVDIVRVMSASANTLHNLNAQVGGLEKVEGVVGDLRAEMENVEEVGGVLREDAVPSGVEIDEDELQEEVEAMDKEERAKQDEKETRRRLAELEDFEALQDTKTKNAEKRPQMDLEDDLQRLSVTGNGEDDSRKEKENAMFSR